MYAWIAAANNSICGAQQKSNVFYKDMHSRLKNYAPEPCPEGQYHMSGLQSMITFWRDKMQKDILLFGFIIILGQSIFHLLALVIFICQIK